MIVAAFIQFLYIIGTVHRLPVAERMITVLPAWLQSVELEEVEAIDFGANPLLGPSQGLDGG